MLPGARTALAEVGGPLLLLNIVFGANNAVRRGFQALRHVYLLVGDNHVTKESLSFKEECENARGGYNDTHILE